MDSGDDYGCFPGIDYSPRLKELYEEIDAVYYRASFQAGFNCEGCDGTKCCTVDLIVHTFAEMLYMRRGLRALNENTKCRIKERSRETVKFKALNPIGHSYRNAICAASFNGRCSIYEYRPMICRLAGISHFIDRPDHTRVFGTGCARFETGFRVTNPELQIDRTPFYRRMAELEIEIIQAQGKRTQSLTIAEILAT